MSKYKLMTYDYTKNNDIITNIKSQITKYIKKNDDILTDNIDINTHKSTVLQYLNTYNANYTINHYYYFFYNYLVKDINIDFKNSVGIDYGCWAGISSIILALFECNKVYGYDFFPNHIVDNMIDNIAPETKNIIEYNIINKQPITNKVDWILIYDVLTDFRSDNIIKEFTELVDKFYNILNKNGILLISDFESNSKIKIKDLLIILNTFKI